MKLDIEERKRDAEERIMDSDTVLHVDMKKKREG